MVVLVLGGGGAGGVGRCFFCAKREVDRLVGKERAG